MARRDFNNGMREYAPGAKEDLRIRGEKEKRSYAYSGRAQTREIPALYADQIAAQQANAFDPGAAGGGGSTPAALAPGSAGGIGGAAPADVGLDGYLGEAAPDDFFFEEDFGYRPQVDDGGRGQDGAPDIAGSRAQNPLSDLDKDVLSALGQVPGFGIATNITRAADYMGLSGVLDDPNPVNAYGAPGTLGFKGYIDERHANELIARQERAAENARDTLGEVGAIGTPNSAGSGYSPYGNPDAGGRSGSPSGGSGGFGGQAGEGAGSGNSAGGGRGDSPGYHEGGYVSEDLIPGELRGDVDTFLQEGEQVLTADATDIIGPGFAEGVNMMAALRRREHSRLRSRRG